MDGQIITELRGRLRFRLVKGSFNAKDFQTLSNRLEKLDGLELCSFNPLTSGLLILYTENLALKQNIISTLVDFCPTAKKTPMALQCLSSGQNTPLPANPIWGHLVKKALPLPIKMIVQVVNSIPYFLKGIKSLFLGRLNVELLDASALFICFLRRDFRSVGTLLFFFALGHFLEMWTKQRTRKGLYKSLSGNATKVWIRTATGAEQLVEESDLTKGCLVIVRQGGLIPVDGVVAEGEGMVNQATMTGEALGVRRSVGSSVFAGTTVEAGELLIRAVKVGQATRVQSLVRSIEESENSKASLQGRAERLADSIVPFSFILSALVFLITRDPIKAGNILLVDYSCAIRLATPLAVLSAAREGNEGGLLVKGGRYFEELARADTIVFDKTGTLTQAQPEVDSVIPCNGFSRKTALRLAACLEEHFPHPVGLAVVRAAQQEQLRHEEEHAKVEYIVAHGIASEWQGQKVLLGSRHFIVEDEKLPLELKEIAMAEREGSRGRSVLYLAVGGRLAALISIIDPLRPEAAQAINQLRQEGLSRAIMLTGDVETTARALAGQAGISEYHSGLLPDQKATFIKGLISEGRHVIMVGDGLNDSAALSSAQVGVSLNDSSALAKDVANVVLINGGLNQLVRARKLSVNIMERITNNYKLIVGLNTLFLGLGLFGVAGPSLIALFHNATTAWVAYRSTRPLLSADDAVLTPHIDGEKK